MTVSLPSVQFLLLRCYLWILTWARFLWQVSRIPLRLVPIHPDRSGGLGFLESSSHIFQHWWLRPTGQCWQGPSPV